MSTIKVLKLPGDADPGRHYVAVLNSHQSKRPCSADCWVSRTTELIAELSQQPLTLLTSVGLNTWEVLVHLANRNRMNQLIVLPETDSGVAGELARRVVNDFRLDPDLVEFGYLEETHQPKHHSVDSLRTLRDESVVRLAGRVIPLSIKTGGRLEALVQIPEYALKVESERRISYLPGTDLPRYELDHRELIPETVSALSESIIHWTRSSHDPFPDELRADFYEDIVTTTTYCRSALATLRHIAGSGRLLASDRFIRGGFKVVSFSQSPIAEALKLMRWRRRYVYHSFEPYGVAISMRVAREMGIKPVFYGDDCDYELLGEEDRPFYQSKGGETSDWIPEMEWRHAGDLSLGELPADAVKYVVFRRKEIGEIEAVTTREVVALFR